jgi:hypothetical protein
MAAPVPALLRSPPVLLPTAGPSADAGADGGSACGDGVAGNRSNVVDAAAGCTATRGERGGRAVSVGVADFCNAFEEALTHGTEYVCQDLEKYEAANRQRLVKGLARKAATLGYRLEPTTAPLGRCHGAPGAGSPKALPIPPRTSSTNTTGRPYSV